MDGKKLGRREFLKLTIATAAAGGLSHFRFLNFGAGVARAQVPCEPAGQDPDLCVSGQDPDICDPTNDNPDQFPLSAGDLVMQSAERTLDRRGVIVLNKFEWDARPEILFFLIGFHEKTTAILIDTGFNANYIWMCCRC